MINVVNVMECELSSLLKKVSFKKIKVNHHIPSHSITFPAFNKHYRIIALPHYRITFAP